MPNCLFVSTVNFSRLYQTRLTLAAPAPGYAVIASRLRRGKGDARTALTVPYATPQGRLAMTVLLS